MPSALGLKRLNLKDAINLDGMYQVNCLLGELEWFTKVTQEGDSGSASDGVKLSSEARAICLVNENRANSRSAMEYSLARHKPRTMRLWNATNFGKNKG